MNWCWLIGHRFKIEEVGTICIKHCRCGETYVLAENVSRLTGNSNATFWRRVSAKKQGE